MGDNVCDHQNHRFWSRMGGKPLGYRGGPESMETWIFSLSNQMIRMVDPFYCWYFWVKLWYRKPLWVTRLYCGTRITLKIMQNHYWNCMSPRVFSYVSQILNHLLPKQIDINPKFSLLSPNISSHIPRFSHIVVSRGFHINGGTPFMDGFLMKNTI